MKIVIIGGSGLIGSKLATRLRDAGHEVNAASPSTGVNALTGEGLKAALAGANVVVDVANSPSFEDGPALEFFDTAGRNLLAAEAEAGVTHHIALSVVGTDRLLASGYFRAKATPGRADRGLARALDHRAGHAVLRIRGRYRRRERAGRRSPAVERVDTADGGGRRCGCARRRGGRAPRAGPDRDRGPAGVAARRAGSAPVRGDRRQAAGGHRCRGRVTSACSSTTGR